MPEDTQTPPDFNLLRKPLSRFADTLGKYTGQMVKTTKGLTGISKVDTKAITGTIQDTRQPSIDSGQYPQISKKPTYGAALTLPEQSTSKSEASEKRPTTVDISEKKPPVGKDKPTMASKSINRVNDTYKNIISSQKPKGDTLLSSIMNRTRDSIDNSKERTVTKQNNDVKMLRDSSKPTSAPGRLASELVSESKLTNIINLFKDIQSKQSTDTKSTDTKSTDIKSTDTRSTDIKSTDVQDKGIRRLDKPTQVEVVNNTLSSSSKTNESKSSSFTTPGSVNDVQQKGIRRLEKPKEVIIANVDELAKAIVENLKGFKSGGGSSGASGMMPQEESGGGLLDLLNLRHLVPKKWKDKVKSKTKGGVKKAKGGVKKLGSKIAGKAKGLTATKKPPSKPKPPKKGFFGSIWSGAKKLGGKAVGAAKAVGSGVMKVGSKAVGAAKAVGSGAIKMGKSAISGVKKVASKLNPIKALTGFMKGNAGKILKGVVKLPIIGPILTTLFAAAEVKDVMKNPELTEKDKKKQVGRIITKTLAGTLAGAVAAGLAQFANIAPGLGVLVGPLAYMGGDFIGRTVADFVMNQVPGIDEKMGEISASVFGLDYSEGSKKETPTPAKAPTPAAKTPAKPGGESENLEKEVKPVDPSKIKTPDNSTDKPGAAVAALAGGAAGAAGAASVAAVPDKPVGTADKKNIPVPKNNVKIPTGAANKTNVAITQGVPGTIPSNIKKTSQIPVDSTIANDVSKVTDIKSDATMSNDVSKVTDIKSDVTTTDSTTADSTTADSTTADSTTTDSTTTDSTTTDSTTTDSTTTDSTDISKVSDIVTTTPSGNAISSAGRQTITDIEEPVVESMSRAVETGIINSKESQLDEAPTGSQIVGPGPVPDNKQSLISKTGSLLKNNFKTSPLGKVTDSTITGGKNLFAGTVAAGSKLKGKVTDKIDSVTPWYVPKVSTMAKMSKSRLGRKGLAMAGGYALKKAKDKVGIVAKDTLSKAKDKGSDLVSKIGSSGSKLKGKVTDKIDSMTPWYVPKVSTMAKMSKSRLGRKGLAIAGGYALKKAKDKVGTVAKDTLSKGGEMGSKLLSGTKAIPGKSKSFLSTAGKLLPGMGMLGLPAAGMLSMFSGRDKTPSVPKATPAKPKTWWQKAKESFMKKPLSEASPAEDKQSRLGSMIKSGWSKTKSLFGFGDDKTEQPKPRSSTGLISRGIGGLKKAGGKLRDKAYDKIDSMTPWYMPKASTMVGMSKTKLGRKGLALAGGYALNKAKGKIKDKVGNLKDKLMPSKPAPGSRLSGYMDQASSLLGTAKEKTANIVKMGKSKAIPKKSGNWFTNTISGAAGYVKDKASSLLGATGISKLYRPSPKPKSSPGLLTKGIGGLKKAGGKLRDKAYDKIDSMTPWYMPKASTMVGMSKTKLGRKGLALAGGYALNKAKGKIKDKLGSAKDLVAAKGKSLLTKSKSAFQDRIKKPAPGSRLSGYMDQASSLLGTAKEKTANMGKKLVSGIKSTPTKMKATREQIKQDGIKGTISGAVKSSSGAAKDMLSKASASSIGSGILRGASTLKEKTRAAGGAAMRAAENYGKSRSEDETPPSNNAVSTNNSSSNSTTVINKYDTDTISRWRSKYIDDQHKPGHYSLYS